jgi:hypothetical protein
MVSIDELRAAATTYNALANVFSRADSATVFDALSTELDDVQRARIILALVLKPGFTGKTANPRRTSRERSQPPMKPLDPRWMPVALSLLGRPELREQAIEMIRCLLLLDGPERVPIVAAVRDHLASESARHSRLFAELVRTDDAALVTFVEGSLDDADPLTRVRAASALLYERRTPGPREPLVDRLLAAITESDAADVFTAAISGLEDFASSAQAAAMNTALVAWQARSVGLKKTRDEIPEPLLAFQLLSGVAKSIGVKPPARRKRRGLG